MDYLATEVDRKNTIQEKEETISSEEQTKELRGQGPNT